MPRKRKPNTETDALSSAEGSKLSLTPGDRKRLYRVLNGQPDDLDLEELQESEIQEAIQKHLVTVAGKKHLDKKTVQDLTKVLQEFLSCFIVIGYNFKGESTQVISVDNQLDADALGTAIHRFLMNSSRGTVGGPPEEPGMYD
tara:strand:+ start:1280 stop:1708 length:429 start_codon:yes stop_codon:yes gene_type:complete